MGLANERRRYNVTPSLIGHTQNDPWNSVSRILMIEENWRTEDTDLVTPTPEALLLTQISFNVGMDK